MVDLSEEIKARSARGAAEKLQQADGAEIAGALARLNPGFTQDVLAALPDAARERALAAAPGEIARQWQRNALYGEDAIGRMMDPAVAVFRPGRRVDDTIETLREMLKTSFITYIYVTDPNEKLLGIVTMRDLLFSERHQTLADVI